MNACLQVRNTIFCIKTHWICVSTVPFSKPVNLNVGEKEKTASEILYISVLLFHVLSDSDVSVIYCNHRPLHYLHSTADLSFPLEPLPFSCEFLCMSAAVPHSCYVVMIAMAMAYIQNALFHKTPLLFSNYVLQNTVCMTYLGLRTQWCCACMLFSILM